MIHRLPGLLLLLLGLLLADEAAAATSIVPQNDGELHVWQDSDELEEEIQTGGFLIDEPEVEAYLEGVLARILKPEDLDPDFFRIKVVRDTSLNAFALPNGSLFIHSGLLARMINEAQLATILSHEVTHVTHHHSYRGVKDQRTKSTLLALLSVSAGAAGNYGSLVAMLGNVGTTAAISGYSRSLEREADEVGWERMRDSGYDLNAAPEVFRILMADLDEDDRDEPFFFGSHPKLEDREENFTRMNGRDEMPIGGDLGAESFGEAIVPILGINGELEMKAGRWNAARDQLWRYRLGKPFDPKGRWLIGETERRAGPAGDPEESRQLLEEALALDPDFAQAHRSLGLLFYRQKDWEAAARHLTVFLDLEPNAVDRAYLDSYLKQCTSQLAPPPSP